MSEDKKTRPSHQMTVDDLRDRLGLADLSDLPVSVALDVNSHLAQAALNCTRAEAKVRQARGEGHRINIVHRVWRECAAAGLNLHVAIENNPQLRKVRSDVFNGLKTPTERESDILKAWIATLPRRWSQFDVKGGRGRGG